MFQYFGIHDFRDFGNFGTSASSSHHRHVDMVALDPQAWKEQSVTAILLGNALTPCGCSAEETRIDQMVGVGLQLSSSGDHFVTNTSLFLDYGHTWIPKGGASHHMTSHHVQPTTGIRREGSPSFFSGHGSSTRGNMLRSPFCFVVQVCNHSHTHCCRSDYPFLVLLPCPTIVSCVINCLCCLPTNLLPCGDIESNPGPTEKEMLEMVIAGQTKTKHMFAQ